MPRRDRFHELVLTLLRAQGWRLVAENYALKLDRRRVYLDLLLEKDGEFLAVEIKSEFGSGEVVSDFEKALGQVELYRFLLIEEGIAATLWLALPPKTYNALFAPQMKTGHKARRVFKLNILIYEPKKEALEWIAWNTNHPNSTRKNGRKSSKTS